jgi:phosphoglycerate dehydrogenase-like enzyme
MDSRDRQNSGPIARTLIVHHQAALRIPALQQRFPMIEFRTCHKHTDLPAALADFRPQIVFSIKETGMTSPHIMQPIFDAPSVKWLHLATIGTDHLPSLGSSRIMVSNSSRGGFPAMAEWVITVMLSANMDLPTYQRQQEARRWNILLRHPVRGRTLLLVGVGWIGKEIARVAKALGMRVIGIKSRQEPVAHVDEIRGMDQLHCSLGEADFVSLQIPLSDATHQFMNGAALAAMKPDAWLINVGRGGLVDEAALIEALTKKKIRGAALDVFEQEPLPASSPLWALSNCIITPHSSGWTDNWEETTYRIFAENLDHWLAGEPPTGLLTKGMASQPSGARSGQ